MRTGLLLAMFLLASCQSTTPAPQPADLVLTGGSVLTLSEAGTQEAVAVNGANITAVGSARAIARYIGPDTQVIDLSGNTVIPGLIEGHGHFLALGQSRTILDHTSATSWAEIVSQVQEKVQSTEPGVWVAGRGWHQDKWETREPVLIDGVPTNQSLNEVSRNNPVLLGHASGHASFANDAALAAAGIDDRTPDPPGGTIVRDASGQATGLLRETAQQLVQQAVPATQNRARFREYVRLAGEEALRWGITSFHDAGAPFAVIDRFKQLERENKLPVRLYVMVRGETNAQLASRLASYYMPLDGNDFLTVRSIKRQIDGALGAHGAWLLEPYEDLPITHGLVLESVAEIEGTARLALINGFQVNTHAIGTRANRETLDLYERVWKQVNASGKDLRWRIEHAQHIHPEDVPRFGSLGVIAAVQGVHCVSDGPWIPRRLGDVRTAETSYPWRALLNTGAVLGNGTDVPVEPINPFASIQASVTRVMRNGEAFHPSEAMTAREALESYTLGNAYAAFEEDVKGSIEPGKLADLVVISQNILTVEPEEISQTEVLHTIIGGELRFSR